MAQVDFDNAKIEVIGTRKPLQQRYLGLTNYNNQTRIIYFMTLSEPWLALSSNCTITVLTNTPTKYSLRFLGTFSSNAGTGSTEFGIYISYSTGYDFFWKVSNIVFNAGDTFDFVVDVDITGS